MTTADPGLLPIQPWSAWDRSKTPRAHKRKDVTAISEHRQMAVADALGAERRERIKAEAREAAARILADWEGRR